MTIALWTVASNVLTAGLMFAGVKYFTKAYIDTSLKRRSDEQVETLKAALAGQLENAKHTLQLDQARQTFVYDHQRESFTNVIRAMIVAIDAIEMRFDYSDEEFRDIDESVWKAFAQVRASESLYTGDDGDRALQLFEQCLRACVADRIAQLPAEGDTIRKNFAYLRYISSRMQEFFRIRLGTSTKNPAASANPLQDVFRLDAVLLLNRFKLHNREFRVQSKFRMREDWSPEEIVAVCRAQGADLVTELANFERALSSDRDTNFFYRFQDEARDLRGLLKGC